MQKNYLLYNEISIQYTLKPVGIEFHGTAVLKLFIYVIIFMECSQVY